MAARSCSGIDVFTGAGVHITFEESIESVEAAPVARAGPWIAPAWIDLQVNGFAGADYNDPATSAAEIGRSIECLFSSGVARFYPTVITGPPERMEAALRNLWRARNELPGGEAIEGFHVEGPHISPEDGPRGAHPRQWVRKPDFEEFRRWQEATENHVRLVTLAPEWPEAPRYIERVTAEGVVASIGHTQASAAQIAEAVAAGATFSTHLGNAAHPVLRRYNYIWDQLAEDRLMAGFIVDGFHLPASFLKVALRAKGISRSVLVTDAAAPAGCAPGRYRLGEVEVELTADQRVVMAGQERLAGSALRMDRGIENLVRISSPPLADAVRMATLNPARAGRIDGRTKGLVAGERADLVEFRFDPESARMEILATWVSGREVYRNRASAPR
ncbi:MAG TPA: N-acetylglucosamine-6-phosphate deacetylase [Bryobacteraceae bacterium]|nr:N-acetylglucosamine-6-phosphate deacetylase [Bryobacteraceae bacterium]